MSAIEQQDSHRPPSDGGMAKEEFIRVGTTLYKIVEQPRLNGGYIFIGHLFLKNIEVCRDFLPGFRKS